jgi:hypothetical protein
MRALFFALRVKYTSQLDKTVYNSMPPYIRTSCIENGFNGETAFHEYTLSPLRIQIYHAMTVCRGGKLDRGLFKDTGHHAATQPDIDAFMQLNVVLVAFTARHVALASSCFYNNMTKFSLAQIEQYVSFA